MCTFEWTSVTTRHKIARKPQIYETATTAVAPPFSRASISLWCWQAAQGAQIQEIKQSTVVWSETHDSQHATKFKKATKTGEGQTERERRDTAGRRRRTVAKGPRFWTTKGQSGRTEAVLILETILGSDAGADDPVGVDLTEAVADGA